MSQTPETSVAENLPVAPEEDLLATYRSRYQGTVAAEEVEHRKTLYPDFPTADDIAERVKAETKTELVTFLPGQYGPGSDLAFPRRVDVQVPSDRWREMFSGTDEELEAYYEAPYDERLQLTNPKLHPSDDEKEQWLRIARQATLEEVAQEVPSSMWWATSDVKVNKDIEDGRLNQVFDLRSGDNVIQLVNCDRTMTEQEVEEVRSVVDRLAVASEGKIFDRLHTVVIQYDDRFNSRNDGLVTVGQAHTKLGVFRLNSIVRDLASLKEGGDTHSPDVPGWSSLQSTLAHELAHMLDLSPDDERRQKLGALATNNLDPEGGFGAMDHDSVFLRTLGWYTKELKLSGEEGRVLTHEVTGIQKPADELLVIDEDGQEQKVRTSERFTEEELLNSMPVSPYGNKSAPEDFGEAFKVYALAGPQAVEPVRRAIIKHAIASLRTRVPITFNADTPVAVAEKPLQDLNLSYSVPVYKPFAIYVNGSRGWKKLPESMLGFNWGAEQGYYTPKNKRTA